MAAPATLAAEVTSVTFTSPGPVYSAGGATADKIEIDVGFDAAVNVSGMPVFNLMVGTDRRRMSFVDGGGSETLRFEYTVRTGDLDEDGVGYPANPLTGGTIVPGGRRPTRRPDVGPRSRAMRTTGSMASHPA